MTELLGREAQAFLSRQQRQQPFFLYLAFGAPHYSMMAPGNISTGFRHRWSATGGRTWRWWRRWTTRSAACSTN